MFVRFIVSIVIGVGIGILSGLLGIGGGTVMVPVFRLGYALPAVVATATSLFAIIPTSISGVVSHLHYKTCIPKLGVALGVGGAIMSPVGVYLAQLSPDWLIMLAAALVIGYSAVNMFRKAIKMKPVVKTAAPEQAAEAAAAAPAVPPAPHLTGAQYVKGGLIGVIAGLMSGYVGVGGGFIMVPMMLALLDVPMKLASGTSLLAIMILAIPGVIEQGMLGNIDYLAGIAIVIGSIPGAVIGARLIRYVPERMLRFVFGAFLLVGAVLLVVKEIG